VETERTARASSGSSRSEQPDVLVVGGESSGFPSLESSPVGACERRCSTAGRPARKRRGRPRACSCRNPTVPRRDRTSNFCSRVIVSIRSWARGLEEETGEAGRLPPDGDSCAARATRRRSARSRSTTGRTNRGLAVETVGTEEIARRLGQGAAAVRAARLFPDEGVVDARRLTRALAESARRARRRSADRDRGASIPGRLGSLPRGRDELRSHRGGARRERLRRLGRVRPRPSVSRPGRTRAGPDRRARPSRRCSRDDRRVEGRLSRASRGRTAPARVDARARRLREAGHRGRGRESDRRSDAALAGDSERDAS
jgi:hypothetical protein